MRLIAVFTLMTVPLATACGRDPVDRCIQNEMRQWDREYPEGIEPANPLYDWDEDKTREEVYDQYERQCLNRIHG